MHLARADCFKTQHKHAGAHGAKVGIMGRRQQVVNESAEKLCSEGFGAIGVQVIIVLQLFQTLLSL